MFQIDAPKLTDACNELLAATNGEYGKAFDELAAAIKGESDQNERAGEVVESCRKMQDMYNDEFCETIRTYTEQVAEFYGIADKLMKKEVKAVQQRDAGLANARLNTDVL